MFIKPIVPITGLNELNQATQVVNNEQGGIFKDIFMNAIQDVESTSLAVDENAYDIATGNTDDLHNLQIELEKAQLSVSYMVQLRNKCLEAYNEISRISV